MKALLLLAMISLSAQAMPELYCLSTSSHGALTHVAIFTNAKGTVRVQAELTSQEGYLADLGTLATLQRLTFDASSNTISNGEKSFELTLSGKDISPIKAYNLFQSYTDEEGTHHVGSSFNVRFKKFQTATLRNFKINAKKNSWQEVLNEAFSTGVTKYVCGNIKDAVKD